MKVYVLTNIQTEEGCAFPTHIQTDLFYSLEDAKAHLKEAVDIFKSYDFVDGSVSNIVEDSDEEFMGNTNYELSDNYAVWIYIREKEVSIPENNLPTEMTIDIGDCEPEDLIEPDAVENYINEEISNKTGFLVKHYNYEIVGDLIYVHDIEYNEEEN